MIDAILHSVEAAEEKADQVLKEARRQGQRISDDAASEIETLKRKQSELFELEAQSKRELVRNEEARKDEEAKAAVTREIGTLQKNAKKRENQIVKQLAAQII